MSDTVKRDNDILGALTDAAQDEFASDPRWEKLSRGELTASEEQEFRALAERFGVHSLFEACKPSTKDERDALYASLRNRPDAPPPPQMVSTRSPQAVGRILPFRRTIAIATIGFAVAASVALAYRMRSEPARVAMAPIPEFVLDPLRGDAENRALTPSDSAVRRFGPESYFNLVFRPKNAIEGPIEARSVLLQGETVRGWNPGVSFQSNGLGRIAGKTSDIFPGVPSGRWQICILVGRPQALPSQTAEIAQKCRSPEQTHPGYWPLTQDVQLERMSIIPTNQVVSPLIVETNGCRRVRKGPICTIPKSRKINVWVKGNRGGNIRLAIDGQAIRKQGTPIQDGILLRLELSQGARNLSVQETIGNDVVGSFQLQLDEEMDVPELAEAEALRIQNEYDQALQKLDLLANDSQSLVQAQVKRTRARILRAQGKADEAIQLFNQAIPLDRDQGRISDEIDDRLALIFTLLMNSANRQDRFTEARHVFEDMGPLMNQSPEGRAMISHFRGLLALETGNLVGALELLRVAHDDATRVGRKDLEIAIAMSLADVFTTLGRFGEARAMLRNAENALPQDADPCQKAAMLTDLGWELLAEHRAGATGNAGDAYENPRAVSEQALAMLRKDCKQPTAIANVLANMALMALDEGKPQDARRYLDEARKATPQPSARVESDWLLAEAHLALHTNNPAAALGHFDKLAANARREGSTDHKVEATLGQARVLEKLGKLVDADAAYAQADALLADKSLLIPMGDGRLSFLARYNEVARHRMSFLLRRAEGNAGARAEQLRMAVDVARRNRARVLSAMQWLDRIKHLDQDKRMAWERSIADYRDKRKSLDKGFADALDSSTADELEEAAKKYEKEKQALDAQLNDVLGIIASPAPNSGQPLAAQPTLSSLTEGELLLVYHPTVGGWVGFAVTKQDITVMPIKDAHATMAPNDLAQTLLDPFRKSIDAAVRIRFAAYGSLDQIRFHALPWNGRTLIHQAPVTYGLDLPAANHKRLAEENSLHAVIVANSRNDLPDAAAEATTVELHVRRLGWSVTKLVGEDATHAAVAAALAKPNTALLHVAGHATVAGVDGWRSEIPLAKGGRLTLGDIVTLPQVPPVVVLSACDGDKQGLPSDKSILTLAQAFTVAGAEEVVAAMDRVNSAQAESLMTLLYKGLRPGSRLDTPALLQAAVLEASQDPRQTEWATFRVIVH